MVPPYTLKPYDFVPHDSYYAGENPHAKGSSPAAVPEVKELEKDIWEGLNEARAIAKEWPALPEAETARFKRLEAALIKVERARFRLWVFAVLSQTQSTSLLFAFFEAQQKRDQRFEAVQEKPSGVLAEQVPVTGPRNRHHNNNLRALSKALRFRLDHLQLFNNQLNRSEHVLSPKRCAEVAKACGLAVAPHVPIVPAFFGSSKAMAEAEAEEAEREEQEKLKRSGM